MASFPVLTALIIDDEPLARQELQYLLDRAGDVSVLGQGTNGVEAVDLIRTHRPDVVFLDVRMPGLDGFAVLRKLLTADRSFRLPEVVFATAFDQYAVKAFEVNAVDYLLKPFDSKRLQQTLDKLRSRVRFAPVAESVPDVSGLTRLSGSSAGKTTLEVVPGLARRAEPAEADMGVSSATGAGTEAERTGESPELSPLVSVTNRSRLWDAAQAKLDALLRMVEEQAAGVPAGNTVPRTGRVVLRTGSRLLLVDQGDVCFAYVNEGRIAVVTKTLEGDSNVRTLEELADQLDSAQFWRAHRSYLVNLQHIREVVPWFRSTYQLRMDDRKGTEIPVSRSQTKRLRELFNL